jgi:hypothetical protein
MTSKAVARGSSGLARGSVTDTPDPDPEEDTPDPDPEEDTPDPDPEEDTLEEAPTADHGVQVDPFAGQRWHRRPPN